MRKPGRRAGPTLSRRARLALADGQLALARMLQEALRGRAFRMWLEKQLARPAPRRLGPDHDRNRSVETAVETARRTFARVPGVRSVHWGLHRRGGKSTGAPGIVVFVENKRRRENLGAKHRLPARLRFRHRGRWRVVRVDVQSCGGPGHLQTATAPSNGGVAVSASGDGAAIFGTLSGLLTLDDGSRHALLSGHVAEHTGRAVWARTMGDEQLLLGSVEKVRKPERGDLAMSAPLSPGAEGLTLGVRNVRDPLGSDVGVTPVRILVARELSGLVSTIDQVGVSATFVHGGQEHLIAGLAALKDAQTVVGDSGAPVLDDVSGQLLGFVVGSQGGRTMVMPARRAIDELLADV